MLRGAEMKMVIDLICDRCKKVFGSREEEWSLEYHQNMIHNKHYCVGCKVLG